MTDDASPKPRAVMAAEILREMANKCEKNASDADFGGAVVIVPPEGQSVEMLVLDSRRDSAMFWANLKTKAEIALLELDEKTRAQGGFGQRR